MVNLFAPNRYTGQAWLPSIGLNYYKARMYSPTLGRFMQIDPIHYADGMNLYAYVGNDPINSTDPTGTICVDHYEPAAIYRNSEGFQPTNRQVWKGRTCYGGGEGGGGGGGFGGGGGGGGTRNQTPAKPPAEQEAAKPADCIKLSDGPVWIRGGGADMTLVTGGGFSAYVFEIPSTGARGTIATGSWLFGGGASASADSIKIDTFGQMLGDGYRFEVSLFVFSGHLIFDSKADLAGGGWSVGGGGGLYGGLTKTKLKSSNMPVCGAK